MGDEGQSAGWVFDAGEPGHMSYRLSYTLAFQEIDVSLGTDLRPLPPHTALHIGLLPLP